MIVSNSTLSNQKATSRRLLVTSGILVFVLATVPFWGPSSLMRTLVEFITLLALAQMWNLLAGYAGMVSVDIGGIGMVEGPIHGAIIFFFIREYLSDFGGWSLILLGLIAVAIMLIAPKGLWRLIKDRYHLELFPVQRRLSEEE